MSARPGPRNPPQQGGGPGQPAAPARPFDAAVAAHRAGRLDEALELYDQAIARGERAAGAYTNIGVILRQRRQFAAGDRRPPQGAGAGAGRSRRPGQSRQRAEGRRPVRGGHRASSAGSSSWPGQGTPRPGTAWASPCATPAGSTRRTPSSPGAGAEAGRPGDPLQPGAGPAASREFRRAAGRHYEARWQLERQKKRDFPQPWWHGEPFAGRTLLLFAEQGFGDTIQFIRFAPQVKALGGRVVLECQPELLRLMRSAEGVDRAGGARHAGGRGGDAAGRPGLPAGQPARHLHRTADRAAGRSPLSRPRRRGSAKSSTRCWPGPGAGSRSASSGRAASPSPPTPTARPASPPTCRWPASRACS